MKTKAKPATNANDARNVVARAALVPMVEVGKAEMYETYPDRSGKQHGELKEMIPATTAKRGSRIGDIDYSL